MNHKLKWTIIIVLAITILIFGIGMIIGNVFYNLALNPNSNKEVVLSADHNALGDTSDGGKVEAWEESKEEKNVILEEWNFEDAYLASRDGLQLHGYKVQNQQESHKWFIGCHGYMGTYQGMLTSAKHFYDMGFHVFLPEARGHGDSEGDYIGMGWDERLDIVDWIEQIVLEDQKAEILLYGVSMGGATVMMVSGEELPSNVKVIVEDCGYTSVWDECSYQLIETFHLPKFPIMQFASLVTKMRAGFWLGEADAVKQVEKSITPMLFLHGDSDTFVPSYMLDIVYEAANCEKDKIIIEGAGHGMAQFVSEETYWDKVDSFALPYFN